MRPQNRKIHSKRQPATNKNYNCINLSNQHKDVEQRRPAHAKPDFNSHVQTPNFNSWQRRKSTVAARKMSNLYGILVMQNKLRVSYCNYSLMGKQGDPRAWEV